jgi:hypothetical protein
MMMDDFTTEIGGVEYLCRNDGTCVVKAAPGSVGAVSLRDFIQVGRNRYQLKEIGSMKNPEVETIRIPRSVEKIGDNCFCGCQSLREVTFTSGCQLKEIGKGSFADSGLRAIRIPRSLEKIGEGCFCSCESLEEITFESDSQLKEIGNLAFAGSRVQTLEIPAKCETLTRLSLDGVKTVTVSRGNENFVMKDGKIHEKCFDGCRPLSEGRLESGSQLNDIEESIVCDSGPMLELVA